MRMYRQKTYQTCSICLFSTETGKQQYRCSHAPPFATEQLHLIRWHTPRSVLQLAIKRSSMGSEGTLRAGKYLLRPMTRGLRSEKTATSGLRGLILHVHAHDPRPTCGDCDNRMRASVRSSSRQCATEVRIAWTVRRVEEGDWLALCLSLADR